jgi:hypothetical protein
MDLSGTQSARAGRYLPSQMVVAIQHVGHVTSALDDLSIAWRESQHSDILGLALLDLPKLSASVAPLRPDAALMQHVDTIRSRAGLHDDVVPDLDLLMAKLRRDFSTAYLGWTPTMGKNRIVGSVEGLPVISGGSTGSPSPIGPTEADEVAQAFDLPRTVAEPGKAMRIGVLDTGLVVRPQLDGRFVSTDGTIIISAEPTGSPLLGHALFGAGLVVKQAPRAQLDVRGLLDDSATATLWDTALMMAGYRGSGIDVLNMSFGCVTDDGQQPLVLSVALDLLHPDIVLVAAAGNHGGNASDADIRAEAAMWPAADHRVIAVAAHDDYGVLAPFSPNAPWVQLTAPGVEVVSLYFDRTVDSPDHGNQRFNGFARWDGTSFASATASGAIAAIAERTGSTAHEAVQTLLQHPDKTDGVVRPFTYKH